MTHRCIRVGRVPSFLYCALALALPAVTSADTRVFTDNFSGPFPGPWILQGTPGIDGTAGNPALPWAAAGA